MFRVFGRKQISKASELINCSQLPLSYYSSLRNPQLTSAFKLFSRQNLMFKLTQRGFNTKANKEYNFDAELSKRLEMNDMTLKYQGNNLRSLKLQSYYD